MNIQYIHVLKTLDSEFRGYANLSDQVKEITLPLFELTRSRKTKTAPIGDIHKRMSSIREAMNGRKFILDLTSHTSQTNSQILDLQDERDGFANWANFIESYADLHVIPVIHANPDRLSETTKLVHKLQSTFSQLAFRFDGVLEDITPYLSAIRPALQDPSRLLVVLDARSLGSSDLHSTSAGIKARILEIDQASRNIKIAVVSSSFPRTVRGFTPQCLENSGRFEIFERKLFREARTLRQDLIYGDYSSVYPDQYDAGGGTWVPRVDFPTDDEHFIYTRYRREAGGYAEAAKAMVANPMFSKIECWGHHEIVTASTGNPGGRSPSHWIAVRINSYITRIASSLPIA